MSAVFPRNLQPTWIEPAEAPARPDIPQRFQSGADSNLRLSSIPIDGKITCEWIVDTRQAGDYRRFWAIVEMAESFTLPVNFFPATCDPLFVSEISAYSATGLWRFAEKYEISTIRLGQYRIIATLRGAIS